MTWARADETASHMETFEGRVPSSVLGRTGLTVSGIGFGGYRVSEHDPENRESLRLALRSGVNLIDTSSNYTDGSSERLIGEVLSEEFASGHLYRERIVVVTKAGYVQGANLRDAKRRIEERRPYPEMVEFSSDCWHNISPEFLEEQISRSLARLKLESLDVLLLHNPEYFLKISPNRETYYARIKKAFQFLESEVERKRIRFYGISSNTFPESSSHAEFTSLDRVWGLASEIKKNHHFAVIQFPMNVFEPGAVTHKNNGASTLLERARELKLGVLINRPFNAFHRGRLIRLTSFPKHDDVDVKGRLHTLLGRIVEMEKRFQGERVGHGLSLGHMLRDRMNELNDVLQWKEVLHQQVIPHLRVNLDRLGPEDAAWATEYRTLVSELLELVTKTLENLASQKASLLAAQLEALAPSLLAPAGASLSQKVLRVYHALNGVNCVLVGMRKPAYLNDVLTSQPMLEEEQALRVMAQMQRNP